MANQNTYVRCHVQNADGTCSQLPLAVNQKTGQYKAVKITNTSKISPQVVAKAGAVYYSKEDAVKLNSQIKNNSQMYDNTIVGVETTQGRAELARRETPDMGMMNAQTIWFTFDNTTGGAVDFMLGDAAGLIALNLGLSAPPGGVTITSSYGASGLSYFAQLTRSIPVRFHKLHVVNTATASSTASTCFFDSGSLRDCRASINNAATQANIIDFRMLLTPDTFLSNVRQYEDYRIMTDALQGWRFVIPALQKITFTLYVRSIGDVSDMNLNF